jgi:hypothetical protein
MEGHLRRRSLTFAKEKPYFEARLNIILLVYNFINSHTSPSKSMTDPEIPAFLLCVPVLLSKT